MNRSYSKTRHINSTNYLLEQKYLEDKRRTDLGVLAEQATTATFIDDTSDNIKGINYGQFNSCTKGLGRVGEARIRFDGAYYYFSDGKFATKVSFEKYKRDIQANPEAEMEYSGTYSCKETKDITTNTTKSIIKRVENPKKELASSPGSLDTDQKRKNKELGYVEGKGDENTWKNTMCALSMNPSQPKKPAALSQGIESVNYYLGSNGGGADLSIFNGYIEGDDVFEVTLYNTGVFYVGSTPYPEYKRGPSEENKFYKYTCVAGKVTPTKEIIGIEGSQGGTSTQSTTTGGGGFGTIYPNVFTSNVINTIRQKIGSSDTSPSLTQDDINKLYDAINK